MVPGELQAQEEDISVDVKGGDGKGQGGVDDSEGNTEDSQEASADVFPLEKHEGPVEQAFSSQTEQDGGNGDVHGVQSGRDLNQASSRHSGTLWRLAYCRGGKSIFQFQNKK